MKKNANITKAYAFDDVSLAPMYSEVKPNAESISLRTRFSRNIELNIPIISAAMDTVTEASMAIALAQLGGIGVIHKNLSIEKQAEEVAKVKRSESGTIVEPITIRPHQKISEVIALMHDRKISGIPVVDENNYAVGIITNRDLLFQTNFDRPVGEFMTSGKDKLITTHVGTTLEEAKVLFQKHRIEKLLVVDDNYILKGLITVKDIQKAVQFPLAVKDSLGRLRVAAAIGPSEKSMERATALVEAKVDALVIDSAHGDSKGVHDLFRDIREKYPDIDLVVGNVATKNAVDALVQMGVDAIKVGMGPGSICTTRVVSGAGIPQLTAILDCVDAAANSGIPIIGDGGIKFSGDITKAIAAGADSVMIGSLLASTEESPGEVIISQGRSYKEYRGMGSTGAMMAGSADRYGQGGKSSSAKFVPEGIEARVPLKGTLAEQVEQLVGGLMSGMGYLGCADIPTLQANATFREVTAAGLKESHVHDVVITKEASNYQGVS